jgi:hypothetical protein
MQSEECNRPNPSVTVRVKHHPSGCRSVVDRAAGELLLLGGRLELKEK